MSQQPHQKILGFIPARGGSKGLPGKNIKDLLGTPLISWTIASALKSSYLERVIVSTDDRRIATVAKDYGSQVIMRPKKLASDTSSVLEAVDHGIRQLQKDNFVPDIIVILQPTAPLRTTTTINAAIEVFLKNFDRYDSLVPLFPIESKVGVIRRNHYHPTYQVGNSRRQDMGKLYKECGTIFIVKTRMLATGKGFGKKMYPFIISNFRESIDIDTLEDFQLAQCLGALKL